MKDLAYFREKKYYRKISGLVAFGVFVIAFFVYDVTLSEKLKYFQYIFWLLYLFISIYSRVRNPILTVLPDGLIWAFQRGTWWKSREIYVTFADFKKIWIENTRNRFPWIPRYKRTINIIDNCDKTGTIISVTSFRKKDRAEIEELILRIQERIDELIKTGKAEPLYQVSVLELIREK
ncbi:MAG: hypothetical protein WCH46_00565 [bacterium]